MRNNPGGRDWNGNGKHDSLERPQKILCNRQSMTV